MRKRTKAEIIFWLLTSTVIISGTVFAINHGILKTDLFFGILLIINSFFSLANLVVTVVLHRDEKDL